MREARFPRPTLRIDTHLRPFPGGSTLFHLRKESDDRFSKVIDLRAVSPFFISSDYRALSLFSIPKPAGIAKKLYTVPFMEISHSHGLKDRSSLFPLFWFLFERRLLFASGLEFSPRRMIPCSFFLDHRFKLSHWVRVSSMRRSICELRKS